jgi:trk system potassium uptake protein TrkH
VTGLIVRDTATQFTPFGQAVIGVFIQLGGLGIIVFGSMLSLMLGRALTLRQNLSLSQMLNDQPIANVASIVKFTVIMTVGFELLGALLMLRSMWTWISSRSAGSIPAAWPASR